MEHMSMICTASQKTQQRFCTEDTIFSSVQYIPQVPC